MLYKYWFYVNSWGKSEKDEINEQAIVNQAIACFCIW